MLAATLRARLDAALSPAFVVDLKGGLGPRLTATFTVALYSALNPGVNPGVTPLLPARVSGRALGYQVASGQGQRDSSALFASGGRQSRERLR